MSYKFGKQGMYRKTQGTLKKRADNHRGHSSCRGREGHITGNKINTGKVGDVGDFKHLFSFVKSHLYF